MLAGLKIMLKITYNLYLFIGCAGSSMLHGFPAVVTGRGCSLTAVHRPLLWRSTGSGEHGLLRLWLPGSVIAAHGLSHSRQVESSWIGTKPVSPTLAGRFFTEPSGKSEAKFLSLSWWTHFLVLSILEEDESLSFLQIVMSPPETPSSVQ